MKICIDPGHGMSNAKAGVPDSGAVGGGHKESVIALAWGHALRAELERLRVPSWMTRSTEVESAPLGSRVARALHEGCTHFVSIHLNAASSAQANGVETLYEGTPKAKFAEGIQGVLVKQLGLTNRKTKWASIDLKRTLAVLKFPGPCALLELGFITNATDRARVLDAEVMRRTCAALAAHLSGKGGCTC